MKDKIVAQRGGSPQPLDRASRQKHSPPHIGRDIKIASDHPAHRPAVSSENDLLTPSEILSRLSMTSSEPAKWMRRTFEKHQVPYVRLCGQVRATEAQYQLLLERVSCFPSVEAGQPASTTFKVGLRKATNAQASSRSVHERVMQMLLQTDGGT
jgi:hypothetical protein